MCEQTYLSILEEILETGYDVPAEDERTGTGTRAIFGHQIRFNLEDGFPLLTTKQVFLRSVIHELLWFLSGSTNIKYLKDNNVKIWDAWADENGELGPVYGSQWRNWEYYDDRRIPYSEDIAGWRSVDQITQVIEQIKTKPYGRRHIVNAWNVPYISEMKLPPCHFTFQFNVFGDKLSCHMNMRSTDAFLGLPFNIASYALLLMMVAQVTGYKAHELIISFGNLHIYNNHFDQVKLQLSRSGQKYALPRMELNPLITDINKFTYDDFKLVGYQYHPHIPAPIAV